MTTAPRFEFAVVDDTPTVVDHLLGRHVIHQADWSEAMTEDVVKRLNERPASAALLTWEADTAAMRAVAAEERRRMDAASEEGS